MMKVTDIFFDLDHTLWDFDKNSYLAFKRVFANHNVSLDVDLFIKEYEPINLAYWRLFRNDEVSKEQLRRGRLIETFKLFDLTFPIAEIDAMAQSYIDELPGDNHLFEGALEVLDYLSKKYTLHIITNGFHEVQHLKLKRSGIYCYFKTVTTSDEVGSKKPHPVIFETALKKASAKPESSFMIGDSYEADILGAKAIGMQTMYYNYRKTKPAENQLFVNALFEIKTIF
ncbi:YjjG family noncanonical pyrimidine nucleotidase [Marixanthomonas spongiae]|uniref:Noncanonical pyrimidine nucleotidase, YjjG family n=1 Tax=Marixanthomonas spongiae TaxID=2174845 RepID=A0A2U0HX46_9FLAO|nr:YjjG family noncanonical pyrimidine nucleotidase [Marixanthomonas spongiae]PVW13417.1 noncanonical pyrimidine nucleotidase, YjjG family [Marixanthomonas spongiae]